MGSLEFSATQDAKGPQCSQEVTVVETALPKLMRMNHETGLVCLSQKGKDANYFQFF